MSYEKQIDELIEYTIIPTLYDDVEYNSEAEFAEIKRYLIDAIKDIEYVEQYNEEFEEEE